MEAIGIIGMIFGLSALYRVYKLEKVLKESGMLDKSFDINKQQVMQTFCEKLLKHIIKVHY